MQAKRISKTLHSRDWSNAIIFFFLLPVAPSVSAPSGHQRPSRQNRFWNLVELRYTSRREAGGKEQQGRCLITQVTMSRSKISAHRDFQLLDPFFLHVLNVTSTLEPRRSSAPQCPHFSYPHERHAYDTIPLAVTLKETIVPTDG
ncbi:hypothetical protein B0J15DRAFT_219046 [Fusarium solani]|uniref:Secreted protein n=1 Tax=Fusarium solani TaxID=169388 RepID=A0A9P9KZQ3_FUSSL|nr:uncharacterized protein B0J15DRAFT_219046 [Fusarium solani]KAH7271562.1 hypothetical protein B0J15DRAFT_219046 [Fusarium solani]